MIFHKTEGVLQMNLFLHLFFMTSLRFRHFPWNTMEIVLHIYQLQIILKENLLTWCVRNEYASTGRYCDVALSLAYRYSSYTD